MRRIRDLDQKGAIRKHLLSAATDSFDGATNLSGDGDLPGDPFQLDRGQLWRTRNPTIWGSMFERR
jgi:hypothetical protein